jgi:molecular chaperone DnaK (HSP70)
LLGKKRAKKNKKSVSGALKNLEVAKNYPFFFSFAVALNYASTRSFPSLQYHIFLDMGASSTKATLVSFQETGGKDSKSKGPTVPEIGILAYAHDRTLGGSAFDSRLLKHLASNFAKKEKLDVDIFSVARAVEKFRNEAYRVKHILSANQDTTSSVSSCPVIFCIAELLGQSISSNISLSSVD